VIGAAIFGSYLTYRIIKNWQNSPIITTIDDSHYSLNKLDFPAVTICPVTKVIVAKLETEICEKK
jgi:hypothetical protein